MPLFEDGTACQSIYKSAIVHRLVLKSEGFVHLLSHERNTPSLAGFQLRETREAVRMTRKARNTKVRPVLNNSMAGKSVIVKLTPIALKLVESHNERRHQSKLEEWSLVFALFARQALTWWPTTPLSVSSRFGESQTQGAPDGRRDLKVPRRAVSRESEGGDDLCMTGEDGCGV